MKISKKNTLLITFNIIKKNTVNKKLFFLVCKIKDVYIFLVDAKNVKDKGGGPLKQFWCHISFFSSAGKGGGKVSTDLAPLFKCLYNKVLSHFR